MRISVNRMRRLVKIEGLKGDKDKVLAHIRELRVKFLMEDKENALIAAQGDPNSCLYSNQAQSTSIKFNNRILTIKLP